MADDAETDDAEYYDDAIAARAAAYRRLIATVAALPPEATDLRAEGLEMLSAIRRSFKTERQTADVRALKPGAS